MTENCLWQELFLDSNIKNRGIRGDTTNGILKRLDQITSMNSDKIFIMVGINDISAKLSQEDIVTNYKEIIKQIQTESADTQIYIQSILPINKEINKNSQVQIKEIKNINNKIKILAKEFNVQYIDLYPYFESSKGELEFKFTNDGIHLNGLGYLMWKSKIQQFVNSH